MATWWVILHHRPEHLCPWLGHIVIQARMEAYLQNLTNFHFCRLHNNHPQNLLSLLSNKLNPCSILSLVLWFLSLLFDCKTIGDYLTHCSLSLLINKQGKLIHASIMIIILEMQAKYLSIHYLSLFSSSSYYISWWIPNTQNSVWHV
jgi:hypothetical protein